MAGRTRAPLSKVRKLSIPAGRAAAPRPSRYTGVSTDPADVTGPPGRGSRVLAPILPAAGPPRRTTHCDDCCPLDTERYRKRLEDLRRELEALSAETDETAEAVELDQTRQGRLSRMDAMRTQAMSVETRRRRAAQLGRVRQALERVEDGEYGECRECGGPIDPRRLDADPTHELCIGCAAAAEQQQ